VPDFAGVRRERFTDVARRLSRGAACRTVLDPRFEDWMLARRRRQNRQPDLRSNARISRHELGAE
jgi:hypothetical protein